MAYADERGFVPARGWVPLALTVPLAAAGSATLLSLYDLRDEADAILIAPSARD